LLGAAQSLVLSLVLYFLSPWILQVWTHGAIEFAPTLMLLMLLYAAVAGIWHIPRVLLMSTNQHIDLSHWSILTAVLSVGLAWFLGNQLHLNGVVAAMLVSEFLIAIICTAQAYNVVILSNLTKTAPQ
jgi:O-antigen/teichoic acid export membrane protein